MSRAAVSAKNPYGKYWHGNRGEWDEECVPRSEGDGAGYCETHAGDDNGGWRRQVGWEGLVGWELPPKGWRCPFADERWHIWSDGVDHEMKRW